MNEVSLGRELAAEFERLTASEPPFRTGLDEAVRAAERDGLRRRRRTRAVHGGAVTLAIVALMIATLVIAAAVIARSAKTEPSAHL